MPLNLYSLVNPVASYGECTRCFGSIDPDFENPCDNPALRKLFKGGKSHQFNILDKDIVDKMIFRTRNPRYRIILELMTRGCMRIGEVLKLTPMNIEDRKLIIRDPKSGKESEAVFLPIKVSDRLKNSSVKTRSILKTEYSRLVIAQQGWLS